MDVCHTVSHFHDFCTHPVDARSLLCFHVPVNSRNTMNLHTSAQNAISAAGFVSPRGVSYQSGAHGCPLTQNTSLSAASCFLFAASTPAWLTAVQLCITTIRGCVPAVNQRHISPWNMSFYCLSSKYICGLGFSSFLKHFLEIPHTPHSASGCKTSSRDQLREQLFLFCSPVTS